MDLLVCVTEVYHPHDLRLPAPGQGAERGHARPAGYRMPNRADTAAVALARRLQAHHGGCVTLLSVAPPDADPVLERYLGLGGEALIRVWDPILEMVDAAAVALLLGCAAARLEADLLLCGDRAFGGDGSGLTGPTVAEGLGWPFVGRVVECEVRSAKCEVEAEGPTGDEFGPSLGRPTAHRSPPESAKCPTDAISHFALRTSHSQILVHRLLERGDRQLIETSLPAVIAVSGEAEAAGYPALARIRRARREVLGLADLGLDPDAVRAACMPVEVSDWAPARPRPRKLFAPPSTASASERLRMVMGGGKPRPAPAQDGTFEGTPEEAAERILQVLRQEKLL